MKKIVVFTAFLTLFLGTAHAQFDRFETIRFGFQLSPTVSWMSTNTNKVTSNGSNFGTKLGMIGEFYFRESYAFTTGIGFGFNMGGALQHEFGGAYWTRSDLPSNLDTLPDGVNLEYSIQYVEIPLGLKMRTREFGYLRYYLEPAVTIGFQSKASGDIKGRGVGNDAEGFNIDQEVNGLNLSWGLGGGLEYALSESTTIVGGLAFQTGFTDATDDNGTTFDPSRGWPDRNPEERTKGKVNAITLRAAIIF
ncbi:MAG: porin family protein [Saprospiraceae bacterium]|nr:porin family protein [Saprospiraceae bacterium]